MSVSKITSAPSENELVNKVNEVIDNLGGGGGGGSYTAGTGIDITNDVISVDTTVIAQQSDIPTNNNQLTNGAGYITNSALSGYQTTSNLVTSLSSASTNTQYPSAKCVYDIVGDIESAINTIRGV